MFNDKLTIEVSSEVEQLNTVVAQVYAQMSLIYSHQDYKFRADKRNYRFASLSRYEGGDSFKKTSH